jgi:hypothetical protein
LDDCFARLARRSATAPPGVRAAEHGYLASMLDRYVTIALAVDDPAWKPRHFEVAFGNAPREQADPLCTESPYVMDTAAGPLRFSGRIDRVDEKDGALRIIDYKSGGVGPPKDIHEGRSLQLTVYAWTLEQLLMPGARCEEAGFLPVGRRVGKGLYREALGHAARDKARWAMREETARNAIAGAVAGIRAGQFAPLRTGDTCMGCGTARACRFDAARVARKHGAATPCLGGDDAG